MPRSQLTTRLRQSQDGSRASIPRQRSGGMDKACMNEAEMSMPLAQHWTRCKWTLCAVTYGTRSAEGLTIWNIHPYVLLGRAAGCCSVQTDAVVFLSLRLSETVDVKLPGYLRMWASSSHGSRTS